MNFKTTLILIILLSIITPVSIFLVQKDPQQEIERKRTFLYFSIGCFCVLVDYFTFINLSKLINPIYSNPLGYLAGSICSYNLNKKFTFKSQNAKLSIIRFSLIIFN